MPLTTAESESILKWHRPSANSGTNQTFARQPSTRCASVFKAGSSGGCCRPRRTSQASLSCAVFRLCNEPTNSFCFSAMVMRRRPFVLHEQILTTDYMDYTDLFIVYPAL